MKRFVSFFLILSASLIGLFPLQAQNYSNILLNGDFEQGLASWTERKCTMTVVDTPVYSGQKAVLVSNRTKIWGGPAQTFTDSLLTYGPGKYIVCGFFRMQSGTDTAKIQIKLTIDGQKVYHQINAFIDSSNWTQVSDTLHLTWDSTSTLNSADIYLQIKHDQTLNYYVDHISLIPDSVSGGPGGQKDTTGFEMDDPISPHDFVRMLGKGFDVSWSEFNKHIASYNEQMVKDIKAAGFDHVRLRTGKNANAELFNILDEQIRDCLRNDVIPIIAYQGHDAEDNPTDANRDSLIAWWRAVAEHYRDYPHKLAFNLLVEISGALSDQPDLLNDWYERVVAAIRQVSPTRLIIISPVELSNPYKLSLLRIPSQANGYLLAEWHFYAAGPSKTSEKKLWTTGTPQEKKLITDKIEAALTWQDSTGLPTWVGAWMPGNYNKGDDYTVPEQVCFASFMVRSLEKAQIPWAVNAIHKFYDANTNQWYHFRRPVIDVLLDPDQIALYQENGNRGAILRLPPGQYDSDFLQQKGFFNHIGSLMIPLDFKVYTYSEPGFTGKQTLYTWSDSSIVSGQDSLQIASLVVEYDTAATSLDRNLKAQTAQKFALYPNFPNPFNPRTTIVYTLDRASSVRLQLFDVRGRLVKTLLSERQKAGRHRFTLNGSALPSGVYLLRLKAGQRVKSIKMVLLK